MPTDELAVSEQELADAAAEVVSSEQAIEQAVTTDQAAPELDSDIDVDDSEFWGDEGPGLEGVKAEEATDDEDAVTDDESDVSQTDEVGTITYKANGEDVSITLEEARKQLSLVGGAKKAFSDKARLQRQLRTKEKELEETKSYKESWDKLEAVKDDRNKLWKLITGEDLETYLEQENQRRSAYQSASPEEKKLMDYEARMRNLEREMRADQARRDKELEEANNKNFEARQQSLHTQFKQEFFNQELPDGTSERVKAMLWRNSVADIKNYYRRYGKITNKMISKAFKDNAAVINSFHTKTVDDKVSKISEEKKQTAKEKAQIAATRNYSEPKSGKEFVNLNPLDLFNKVRGKK